MDRRDFLKLSGTGVGLAVAGRTLIPRPVAAGEDGTFRHGVASGDPLSDAVIIWSRVTPNSDAVPGSGLGSPTEVRWQVATDPGFAHIAKDGIVQTDPKRDHTVKIDVRGLDPATTYYYRFRSGSSISPKGRTRTAPGANDERSVRFGLASCANWEGGYFAPYGFMAERDDLDFVLHVGDYLYEYGAGGYGPGESIGRVHSPDHEIVSLSDYRMRHAQYKTDPHLQALHATAPFISTWDDHEVTNNTWKNGAENHQPEEEGKFITRRNRAYQAYFEWMPIRLPDAKGDPTRIYRRESFGHMADLHVLDTRQYRDEQATDQVGDAKDDPARTITGDPQMAWFKKGLEQGQAKWRLVGNQLMIAPWNVGNLPFNVDSWDGYRADRQELLDHISGKAIDNVVFLTGDIHSSWACDVPLDSTYPVSSSVAVELVGTSITSDNLDEITGSPPRTTSIAVEEEIKVNNPHIKMVEFDSHGYSIVDATSERLQMDWYYVADKNDPKTTQQFAQAWQVAVGSNSVAPADQPIGAH